MAPSIPRVATVAPGIAPVAAPRGAPAGNPLKPEERASLAQRIAKLDELDYFQVLMLPTTTSPAEIKKAFYRESRAFHPDRFFHLADLALKEQTGELYKRITEAYYVLRDDQKRRQYLADVSGPDRAKKLRFTEASESEAKQAVKREQEEQIGIHPKGRQFYQTAMKEYDAQHWSTAERALKTALTYEPQNARYKERLAEVQKKIWEEEKKDGGQFKIK